LITRETQLRDGDLAEGIRAAIEWIADSVPVYSLNFVLATPTELWALRYPETNKLFALERAMGGEDGCRSLNETSAAGSMHVLSAELATCRSVVIATERMDDDPAWRLVEPGELLHVPPDLDCVSRSIMDRPPAQRLTLQDLDQRAAASQSADNSPITGPTRDGMAGAS
jgi:glutamine amidotransferase